MRRSAAVLLLTALLLSPAARADDGGDSSDGADEAAQGADSTPIEKGAYASFGIGAAAFAGSMAAGIYALHLRLGLEEVCQPRNNCPLSVQPNIDEMNRAALASTIVGGVGLAAMAAGTILILLSKKSASEKPASKKQQASVSVGPAGVHAVFRF